MLKNLAEKARLCPTKLHIKILIKLTFDYFVPHCYMQAGRPASANVQKNYHSSKDPSKEGAQGIS